MARIYVGTYRKYNSGSIAGAWLDLEDYADRAAFLAACAELHKDEEDPELMFQDWEDIPEGMVCESNVSVDVWEWLALDQDDRKLLAMYREHVNQEGTMEEARDAYAGHAASKVDFASDYWEETGMLDQVPEFARSYIDWDSVARDMELGGDYVFARERGGDLWVFRTS